MVLQIWHEAAPIIIVGILGWAATQLLNSAKTQTKICTWMKSHEELDNTRFNDIKELLVAKTEKR